MRSFLFAFTVILALSLHCDEVRGHSWLACTDYTEKNGGSWNPNKCRGFPRQAQKFASKTGTFGLDSGYDHRPSEGNPCRVSYDADAYTSEHPMAVYYPGQQAVIVHPMKNHGADIECGTIWMPDHGSWLFRSRIDPSFNNDPTLSQFRNNMVFDLGRSPSGHDFGGNFAKSSIYPKPGFGNAPNFCENTDKAMGTFSFNVPRNLRPGLYTFIWLWSFNSERDLYSCCFEVEIVPNKAIRDSRLRSRGFNDMSEPCGGITSNPEVMGNNNPGCSADGGRDSYEVSPPETSSVTTTTTTPTTEYVTQTPRTSYTQSTTTYYPPETTPTQDYYANQQGIEPRRPPDLSNIRLSIEIHMRSTQFSGEMWLPAARDNTIRRYISVDFTCDVDMASFWNCRTISDPAESRRTNHYDLVQRGSLELHTNLIYYHVSFGEPCDLSRHPPVARLVQEELL